MPEKQRKNKTSMDQLGILGGTFDPVHLGHLRIAQAALEELALTQVLFLPDGDPPHKQPFSSKADRLEMLRLACQHEPRFQISDMELKREGTTYTVDTLLELKAERPAQQLIYLVGSDTFLLFPSWHTAKKVAKLCQMAILLRPGDDLESLEAARADFRLRFGLQSLLMQAPGLPLSSSQIRDCVRQGLPLEGLVPEAVADYIRARKLYRIA